MSGASLEVFKFGLYLFFPLAIMVHYGDPEWYHKHVLPVREQYWPNEETLYHPPRTSADVKSALEEYRQKRIARRTEERTGSSASSATSSASSSKAPSTAAQEEAAAPFRAARARDVQASVPVWAAQASRRLV
ncbi:unnamed protein product [Tilletia controversa]|uniref:Uncharacterized protein n=3 Tax=Tilletia TaxID=13289 RepID=A0A8X7SVM9_9BASI|nr:hypothetical protein CF336_g6528 [Tilletia laevis]KAE8194094.1 hypothetical protein CF328_g4858 [Tilletia controversa]KAE8260168.1 hypothetical protein A4X03_0g3899 [Tilletia caries]KAE8194290.1 hypothetical protein CF335_g5381 [Tilletia laevis]KAE8245481.1 hypothetical protein A4X06_0g5666 [Tilletia controversa]